MKFKNFIIAIAGLACLSSCNKYLNVVPDNVPTFDQVFQTQQAAERFLFTCYSFIPQEGNLRTNPVLLGCDQIWSPRNAASNVMFDMGIYGQLATGQQNVVKPVGNLWSWDDPLLFVGIRDCNIFLANINKVPMEDYIRKRWIGEVQFMKAYFYWYLVRMYGPVPIVDKSLPVSASVEDAQLKRQPVDSCFNYIVRLLDTAAAKLPDVIPNPHDELGRVTRPAALAIKARILMAAASPLFNGNTDYANFKDKDGTQLFNPAFDPKKWEKAVVACKEAIDVCHAVGISLNRFIPSTNGVHVGPEMKVRMDLRTRVTDKWNPGTIWSYVRGNGSVILQETSEYPYNATTANASGYDRSVLQVPLKIAKMYYTKHGVPIDDDKKLDFSNITALRTADSSDRFEIEPGYTTARLNFDRGPRFYADLGFDGGILFGAGNYVDTTCWHYEAKNGQYSARGIQMENYTGYFPKKLVSYLSLMNSGSQRTTVEYPWPIMRLADLYLLYAEALNEVNGPGAETYRWIDSVRARAGIPSVEESWSRYAKDPSEYTNKNGLRKIIHRERLIEMSFENRFWDLRRWKEARQVMNAPIQGWDGTKADAPAYYRIVTLYNQTYLPRDYLWPIREIDLAKNHKLVQNPGW